MERTKQIASTLGIDFDQLWQFLLRFEPILRGVILTILEQVGWLPAETQEEAIQHCSIPSFTYSQEQIVEVAASHDIEASFLNNLFQKVGPILGHLIWELINKRIK